MVSRIFAGDCDLVPVEVEIIDHTSELVALGGATSFFFVMTKVEALDFLAHCLS